MGAQKSVHAGKAKIDVNVDFTHKLCASLMIPPLRDNGNPLSLIIGSLTIKHPNLFGCSEKLDVSWDKGLYDSNVLVAYRRPRPEWLPQQCFVIQHSMFPELAVNGTPIDNFSRTGTGGVNLSRLSAGLNLSEPASSHWSNTTSIKFEHVRLLNDEGRSVTRDLDGFPLTCSGSPHDSMVVLKQESLYAKANDRSFCHFSMQIEQGIPFLSKWLIFNRFKFVAMKGINLGPALFLASLTGGSIVGDMSPYQAFAIGGLGSVRGYGEGAVGSGRSCLVANTEFTLPLSKMLEGALFLDCGTDLGSGRLVPGNPALRKGKPGSGIGFGYGLRFKAPFGHFQFFCAIKVRAKVHVHILNTLELERTVKIHCQSKDDDIGNKTLEFGNEMHWSFNPTFWGSTLFFCDVQWRDDQWNHFDAYDDHRDLTRCISECRWIITSDGGLVGYNESCERWEVFHFHATMPEEQRKNQTVVVHGVHGN